MPHITDAPPVEVTEDLGRLRSALDAALPAKLLDRNLIIGTWRWRQFEDATRKWTSGPDDRPRRDLRSVRCICEIVARFDVIAIQGIMGDAPALELVMDVLGDNWGVMLTGLSQESYYRERTAFIFDTRKVLPKGLAGQVVLGERDLKRLQGGRLLSRQFFRPPFFASFGCLDRRFTLANMHLVYGQTRDERTQEARAIADWLLQLSRRSSLWESNIIALGQVQLQNARTQLYKAFTSSGLRIPKDLRNVPTVVTRDGSLANMMSTIAWFPERDGSPGMGLEYLRGGHFNFAKAGLRFLEENPSETRWYVSDQVPLWAEFSVRRPPSSEPDAERPG
jgi:hypothetical protein